MATDVPEACTALIMKLERERAWHSNERALYDAVQFILTIIRMEAQKEEKTHVV